MSQQRAMSLQTRVNWMIDAAVFLTGILAALSGIYFLIFTSGGYQGGRNPLYGVVLLFERATWEDLHTWGGVLVISAIAIHFVYHLSWIEMMSKRILNAMRGKGSHMSRGAKINLIIGTIMAFGFLITALSGMYFLFIVQPGGYEGGANIGWDPGFIFARTTWDIIHTWVGLTTIVAAILHFAIHWRWVTKVTDRFFTSLTVLPARQQRSLEPKQEA